MNVLRLLALLAAVLLLTGGAPAAPGEQVVRLSAPFLGTPYLADTLGGGPGLPEQLAIRPDAVDCFTFLDYVEAQRRSASPAEFRDRLVEVRYRDGVVAWANRRHFFTDWAAAPEGRVADVTAAVGECATLEVEKELNRKADGTLYLPGVAVQSRVVSFVPGTALSEAVLSRLHPGDYLGIYTPAPGLDVSHVGIVVQRDGRLWLRHASSRRDVGQVIDSDLAEYLAGKPGIVVLRPR